MNIPEPILSYWSDFLRRTGRPTETSMYHFGPFGDRETSASALAELILRGEKVATASLLWEYELEKKRVPRPGDLTVVTDWGGSPLCVIQTSDVRIQPFDEVDEHFAAAEGEGDQSLEFWRRVHWSFFGRLCEELGLVPSMKMPIVCERFRLVHPVREEDSNLVGP